MATTKRDVIPILDIESAEFADQYQLGAWWARYGDEQGHGPQPDTYFITKVTTLIENGHLNNLQSAWFPNLGFFLGMIHGGVLSTQTSELRPNVTTLARLTNPHFTRGYRAGRVWFFYESDPNKNRLTDTSLMQRLHELATERFEYRDRESTINFVLGCVIGELSGQMFPLTQEEHERIQEEGRQFLAEYEAQQAKASQEHDTEPLQIATLQEA
jgi:hypothetical protein